MNIYLIAGEASGDALGARLMAALRDLAPGEVTFRGIGGSLMVAEGLGTSLFPMAELSLMGIAEIAPKVLQIRRRIEETIEDILACRPDIVISIDAPDFCFRVVRGVRERAGEPPLMVHYVAPTVWAWRPGRAAKVARFLDGLLCLLPFEPPYFEREGLPAAFVGHSVVETGILDADPGHFRRRTGIPGDAPVLGLLPGSRRAEIARTGGVLFEATQQVLGTRPNMHIVIPTLPHLVDDIRGLYPGSGGKVHIVCDQGKEKWEAFAACDVAMATSGTVGLELAVCGVPHVIGYRMNAITWEMVRRLLRVRHAHLANLVLEQQVVPEFIQDACDARSMAAAVATLLDDPAARDAQRAAFFRFRRAIGAVGEHSPSRRAASFVLDLWQDRKLRSAD